jgi:predicted ATPase
LVTLVGAGGIGKTRLAIEAASRLRQAFMEGIWFIDLAAVVRPGQVIHVIGRELSIPEGTPSSGEDKPEQYTLARLVRYLRGKELLLVLDNCEHLLDACVPVTQELMQHCPGLKILATSRERFDIPEEQVVIVEPLEIPEDPSVVDSPSLERLQENDSIRLFADRARSANESFLLNTDNAMLLVRICRMLDGMPLAIELTASRLHSLSLSQIADNLEQSIGLLRRDHEVAVPRHKTLEAALGWSYCLLNEDEQALFRLATIFRGGFDLAAFAALAQKLGYEAATAEQILAHLVEKSLVSVRELEPGCIRYVLLEPIRQFGQPLLEVDPAYEQILEAHAAYYLQLAMEIGPRLLGGERKDYIRGFDLEAGNLRKSLHYFLDHRRVDECLQFSHAVWEGYWLNQGYFSEGRDWVDQVLRVADGREDLLYGSSRLARGSFAWTLGNNDEALVHIEQALEHGRRLKDPYLTQWAHYWKAIVLFDLSEFDEAFHLLSEGHAIATNAGIARGAAWCTFYQAQIARVRGQTEHAISLFKESLKILSDLDVFGAGWCFVYLAHLELNQRNLDAARDYLDRSNVIFGGLENPRGLGGTERGYGILELEAGNMAQAEMHLRRSRRYFDRLGWIKMSSSSDLYMGFIAAMEDRVEEAADLLVPCLGYHYHEGDLHMVAQLLFIFGLLAIRRTEHAAGARLFAAAQGMQQELGVTFPLHLVQAVEKAERELRSMQIDEAGVEPWEDHVNRILGDHEDWLDGFRNQLGLESDGSA